MFSLDSLFYPGVLGVFLMGSAVLFCEMAVLVCIVIIPFLGLHCCIVTCLVG